MNDTATLPSVAVIGGTGKEGRGLALRWAKAGYKVVVGSRDGAKAREGADALNAALGGAAVVGMENGAAVAASDIAVLAVPYSAQLPTATALADALAGKILIDVTVPLGPPDVSVVKLPNGQSAVQQLQAALGPAVSVVAAFQNVSAVHLSDLDHGVDCDVLVCGDDDAACEAAIALANAAGMTGWRAGPLSNAVVAEGLTSILIGITRRYGLRGPGIRITGSPAHGPKA